MAPHDIVNDQVRMLADAVRAGLSQPGQKELPCSLLYDELGSTLFQAITLLPEYGVTRAEMRLFRRHAAEMGALLPNVETVAELGSGDGSKARMLLGSLTKGSRTKYCAIDISERALADCAREVRDMPGVEFHPLNFSYSEGLRRLRELRNPGKPMVVLFLGSTISNFHRHESLAFMREVRSTMDAGDALLLGADLDKPESQLLPAYDDPTGVTAAFSINLLGHINRALDADFDLRGFAHEARFNTTDRRIEMHLRSVRDQKVTIRAADFQVQFRPNETIWAESSYRYSTAELETMAARSGFSTIGMWVDPQWAFASTLWRAN